MSFEWSTVCVEDVCDLIVDCLNKTAPVVAAKTPYRMIRTTNVRNGSIDLSECKYVEEVIYEKWTRRAKLEAGDVILTREAPIGEVGLITNGKGVFLGQRLMQYRAKHEVLDSRYLLYSFLSPALQNQFRSHEGSGSVVSHIRVGDCFKFKLKLPPLQVQTKIATLLGALDDRITLLRETNATLEAIAQALFKSWFIDFDPVRAKMEGRAPEGLDEATAALFPEEFEDSKLGLVPKGWRSGHLGELALTKRKQLRPSELHADLRYVGLEHMPRKSLSLVDWGAANGLESAKAVFCEGDLLFGKLRPYFHKVVIAPFDGVCSTDVLVCQATKPVFYGFVAMQLFSDALVSYAERLSNGAKMPRTSWSNLADYSIVIPEEEVSARFTDAVKPLFEQMKASAQTARLLATLRNTLLPRLISGQLNLPEITEALIEGSA
jgi:type I restriction enzyme S subunit